MNGTAINVRAKRVVIKDPIIAAQFRVRVFALCVAAIKNVVPLNSPMGPVSDP